MNIEYGSGTCNVEFHPHIHACLGRRWWTNTTCWCKTSMFLVLSCKSSIWLGLTSDWTSKSLNNPKLVARCFLATFKIINKLYSWGKKTLVVHVIKFHTTFLWRFQRIYSFSTLSYGLWSAHTSISICLTHVFILIEYHSFRLWVFFVFSGLVFFLFLFSIGMKYLLGFERHCF